VGIYCEIYFAQCISREPIMSGVMRLLQTVQLLLFEFAGPEHLFV